MSAAEVSPAPMLEPNAIDGPVRGNEHASEPTIQTKALSGSARTLNVAPEPITGAKTNGVPARVHESVPAPRSCASAITTAARGHEAGSEPTDTPRANVYAAPTLDPDPPTAQQTVENQAPCGGGQADPSEDYPPPTAAAKAITFSAGGNGDGPPVTQSTGVTHTGSGDGWAVLRMWAEMYFDVQKARIACKNRMERGGGIDGSTFAPQLQVLKDTEDSFKRALALTYRREVPKVIRDWQKATPGIGEPLLARLLGHLGHPASARPAHWLDTPDGEDKRVLIWDAPYERSLRQLWSYCGHGDATRKKAKGMTADDAMGLGSPVCKMLVHLLAVSAMKSVGDYVDANGEIKPRARSPFRDVYEARRAITEDREGWTPMHQMNDALRITGKEILRDLWLASRQEVAS